MTNVRINGNSSARVSHDDGKEYAVWSVEVQDDDGNWNLVTACYGGASLSSATLIARAWKNEIKLPSPLDAYDFIDNLDRL